MKLFCLIIVLIVQLVNSKVVFPPAGVVPKDRCSSANCEDEEHYYCLAYGIGIDPEYPSVKPKTSPQCFRRKGKFGRCLYSYDNKIIGDKQCEDNNFICSSNNQCVYGIDRQIGQCMLGLEQCLYGLKCKQATDDYGTCTDTNYTTDPDIIIPNDNCTIHAEISNGNCNDEDNYYCLSFKTRDVDGKPYTPQPSCRRRVGDNQYCDRFADGQCLKQYKCFNGKCVPKSK